MYWISKSIHSVGRLKRRWLILLAVVGPGIITMVADNDAGGISTYAQTGAKTGFNMLWIFIILTMIFFAKIEKWAMYLLIPYILWVSFASVLNCFIWLLNL